VANPDRDDQEVLPGLDPGYETGRQPGGGDRQRPQDASSGDRAGVCFLQRRAPDLWGEDEHPRPLDYLLVSVGF
jgi:hypothetical protein